MLRCIWKDVASFHCCFCLFVAVSFLGVMVVVLCCCFLYLFSFIIIIVVVIIIIIIIIIIINIMNIKLSSGLHEA